MPLFEMDFKIRHDCILGRLSVSQPTVKILVWSILEHDIVELIPEIAKNFHSIADDMSKAIEPIERVENGSRLHLIATLSPCSVENILEESAKQLRLIPISPVVYRRGWEYHRVVAFNHGSFNRLMDNFRDRGFMPVILRKVPFNGFTGGPMTLTTDALFSDLTDKQIDALLTAYSHGYYKLPRDADIQTIAAEIDMPRTTFQEHLKKAENKIVNALVPHIHAWQHFYGGNAEHSLAVKTHISDHKG